MNSTTLFIQKRLSAVFMLVLFSVLTLGVSFIQVAAVYAACTGMSADAIAQCCAKPENKKDPNCVKGTNPNAPVPRIDKDAYCKTKGGENGVSVSVPPSQEFTGNGTNGENCVPNSKNSSAIMEYAQGLVLFLSFGVGIAVVGGVVFGGIKYMTAQGNSSEIQKAISIIANSLIGLLLYILAFAIINFLVPGGLIG